MLFLGKVHAKIEKFYLDINLKCLVDDAVCSKGDGVHVLRMKGKVENSMVFIIFL